jgi:basic membrane protein A and related proteins
MAYEGLKQIESELGAEVQHQQATGTQIRDAMRSYAQKEFDLVFGHGFEYNEPGVQVSKDFPNTVFVSSSGGSFSGNAGAIRFNLEQGFYLAGYLAAKMSKSGVVAMIGGPDVPSIRSTFKGFRAGAEAGKPGTRVIEIFTGQEADVAAARQATLRAIGQGADFVIHQANAAAQGVFDAARERGVYAFGSNLDQNDNPSGAVIASAVIVARPAFIELARSVRDRTYQGQVVLMGMDKGAIDFVLNPEMKDRIPAELASEIEALTERIRAGDLEVPRDEF